MSSSSEINPPAPTAPPVNSAARIRMAQIAAANAAVEAQRQKAPSAIATGSQEEAQVRQEAANALQQSLSQVENFNKTNASTPDQFAAARQAAAQNPSLGFNYAAFGYTSRGVPASYVDTLGNRIVVPQGGITGGGFSPGSVGISAPPIQKSTPTPSVPTPSIPLSNPSGTQNVSITDTVSAMVTRGPSTPQTQSAYTLLLSQSQEAKTDALRASMGLAPIEQTVNVQTVKGTQSSTTLTKPTTPNQPQTDLRQQLASLQGIAAQNIGPNQTEAVPFLSFTSPISVTQKTITSQNRQGQLVTKNVPVVSLTQPQGTDLVPGTTIFDALQFVPFGGIAGKSATDALRGVGSLTGKITTTTGETIIPQGFKPPEEQNIFDVVKNLFSKQTTTPGNLPPINQMSDQQFFATFGKTKEEFQSFYGIGKGSSQNINLGRGIGKEVSTEEGGGLSSGNKPSGKPPGETPSSSSSGQVLEQISKEKETPKAEPIREKEMQKYQESLTGKGKGGFGSTQELEPLFLVTPPQTKQTTDLIGVPFIPSGLSITNPPIITQRQTQKQTGEQATINDLITGQVTRTGGGNPEIPGFSDTTTSQVTRQTSKQQTDQSQIFDTLTDQVTRGGGGNPPPDILGGGIGAGLTGGGGIGSSSSTIKSFVGNVPEFDIVGVYKRSETIYGNPKTPKSSTAMGKLFNNKAKKIL